MKACQSKHEPESAVCTSSVLMTPYKGVVEAVFIKEERVWDESVTEVRVKEENEYYMSKVLLKGIEKECALSQAVRSGSQEVRVKVERVSESSEEEKSLTVTEDSKECLSTKKDREHGVSVGGVRIKEENVEVDIEKEYEVCVKEEVELSPDATRLEDETNYEIVLSSEGPKPRDIFFAMRDSMLALNDDADTTIPERSHHTEELLVPTCSVKLKPDSTEPAFDQIPSVIRARTTLTRKARTKKRTCTCDYCGKQFVKKTNLVSHIMIHMGIKRYFCNTCNKAYTNLYNLKRHKLIHTGIKPYSCELCKKTFTDPCNLVIHRRTHQERETFTCKICNKQFKQNHSLKSHRRVHTGDKPFSCEICKRSFSNPSNLKRHYRVHTGEKPHGCKFCKKRYVDLRDLTRHERTHTETPVP